MQEPQEQLEQGMQVEEPGVREEREEPEQAQRPRRERKVPPRYDDANQGPQHLSRKRGAAPGRRNEQPGRRNESPSPAGRGPRIRMPSGAWVPREIFERPVAD